jgi:hypothetical protein
LVVCGLLSRESCLMPLLFLCASAGPRNDTVAGRYGAESNDSMDFNAIKQHQQPKFCRGEMTALKMVKGQRK